MDEAMLPLDYGHGQREAFYDAKNLENQRDIPP